MHPTALQLGPLTLNWFGVLVAAGFLVGLWTASRRAPRAGVPGERIADLGPWLIVGAIVGSRAHYVIAYRDTLFLNPVFPGAPWTEVFMVRRGGLVFYGGLLGAALACVIYARWKRLPLWRVADILVPGVALGAVFGRIGCFMNGCCFGRPSTLPWAVRFPGDSFAAHHQAALGLADAHGPSVPVHPAQVYDALLNLALYGALAWLFRRRRFDGQVFAAYLMGYAVTRSLAESFRGDYALAELRAGLTPGQVVSLAVFAAGAILFAVLRRRGTKGASQREP